MPSNIAKGKRLEYKAKAIFQARGYTVFRCAGSKPVDLIAIKHNLDPVTPVFGQKHEILLIECKKGGHYPMEQKLKQIALAKQIGAKLILVEQKNRKIIETQIYP